MHGTLTTAWHCIETYTPSEIPFKPIINFFYTSTLLLVEKGVAPNIYVVTLTT